jgi:hypothetical protein
MLVKQGVTVNIQLIFRVTIVIEIIIAVAFVFIDVYLVDSLPQSLQDYLLWKQNQETTSFGLGFLGVLLIFVMVHITSAIYLVLLKYWAIKPYILTGILLMLSSLFYGPTVEHALITTIEGISSTLFGVTLAMLLFCNVIPLKNKPNNST